MVQLQVTYVLLLLICDIRYTYNVLVLYTVDLTSVCLHRCTELLAEERHVSPAREILQTGALNRPQKGV